MQPSHEIEPLDERRDNGPSIDSQADAAVGSGLGHECRPGLARRMWGITPEGGA